MARGEERDARSVSRRDVPTYDLAPEMSAAGVADDFATRFRSGRFAFAHRQPREPRHGRAHGRDPRRRARRRGGRRGAWRHPRGSRATWAESALVTADHGNAEQMLESDGSPHTAHTTNPVPLLVTRPDVHAARARPTRRCRTDRARPARPPTTPGNDRYNAFRIQQSSRAVTLA